LNSDVPESVYRKSEGRFRETSEEDFAGGDEDEGFGRVGAELVVLAEAAKQMQPAKGSFDDPAAW